MVFYEVFLGDQGDVTAGPGIYLASAFACDDVRSLDVEHVLPDYGEESVCADRSVAFVFL